MNSISTKRKIFNLVKRNFFDAFFFVVSLLMLLFAVPILISEDSTALVVLGILSFVISGAVFFVATWDILKREGFIK